MYKGKKQRCLARLEECWSPMTIDQVNELNKSMSKDTAMLCKSGHHRAFARLPSFRMPGPLRLCADS
eukprot:9834043-Karenia_brevis.AAC.1